MKRIVLLTTAITMGLVAADSAVAFGGRGGPEDRPTFQQIDNDGDGKISAAELEAFPAARAAERFKAADADGDGKISAEEMAAAFEKADADRKARRIDRMMSRLDADEDGAISEEEMTAAIGKRGDRNPGERMLKMADADEDGMISEEEYAALADKIEKRMGRKDRMGKDGRGHGGKGHGDRGGMRFWQD